MSKDLKTLFITFAMRNTPDNFPPIGAMAVIASLKKAGYYNTELYNMDVLRPSFDEAISHIVSAKPDVLAISCPVSTGYASSKLFSLEIKKRLPDITILLGGNMAASAEIILKNTGVDFCFLGDGEIACPKFYNSYFPEKNPKRLLDINGLAFILNKELVVTGYADQVPKEDIYDIDWDLLDNESIDNYFPKIGSLDPESSMIKFFSSGINPYKLVELRRDQTVGVISCSKGCFNRCTYCHRFAKGLRIIPVDIVINRIKKMIDRFNVGVFSIADECFGASEKWLTEFCKLIKPLDVLWKVGGMRVDMVNSEVIRMMKDAGCRTIIYGMESGSERILNVMEKRVASTANLDAARATIDTGLHTTVQLVIGMPGESPETIKETAEYTSKVLCLSDAQDPNMVSINFAQALPGTPLYEYARSIGKIGNSLEEEEQYLLQISNRNAADSETTINFTNYSRSRLLSWPYLIRSRINYSYSKKFGNILYLKNIFQNEKTPSFFKLIQQKRHNLLFNRYPFFVFKMRFSFYFINFLRNVRKYGLNSVLALLIKSKGKSKSKGLTEYKSLRHILADNNTQSYCGHKKMIEIRKGR